MIQLISKQMPIAFRFAIYTPPTTQPRVIKAKSLPQIQKQAVNLNKILKCFQITPFQEVNQPLKDKQQSQQSIYFLNQILTQIKKSNSTNKLNILKQFQENNLFQHFFSILSKRYKFGREQQEILSTLLTTLLSLYTYCNYKHVNQKILLSSVSLLNKYLMLIPLNLKIISLYFKFSIKYREFVTKVQRNQVKFVNDKFIFDFILQAKQSNLSFDFVILTLKYCWHYAIEARYHQKNQQIMTFLLSNIPKNWAMRLIQQQNSLKNFLTSFVNINFYNKNMVNGIKYILKQNFDKFQAIQICLGIKILIQLRQITKENIKQFLPLIKKLFEKQPALFFTHIISELFRISIWQKQIWIPFFEWLTLQKNFEKINGYYLYSIYCLMSIDKDLICPQIVDAESKTRNYILQKHSFRYDRLDLLKQFYSMIKQQFKAHMTVQQSFTNNLRLISQVQIKSQVQISLFFVDIVIGNKTVIQVNNRSHYIHNIDDRTYFYNIKSQFRKRILEKLGYKYMDIDIFQMKQGSFQLIQNLYNIGVLSNESKLSD